MPPAASLSKIVLRLSFDSNDKPNLNPMTHSIIIGNGFDAQFKVPDDAIDALHGTFERTVHLGVWVYSDHSRYGSLLNEKQTVHNDAVVVHDADRVRIGATEITLRVESNRGPEEEDDVEDKQGEGFKERMSGNGLTGARRTQRRASSPANVLTKAQQVKQRLPRIETSRFRVTGASSSVPSSVNPPEYCQAPEDETTCPPPLEYSSSPAVSPSFLTARTRRTIPHRPVVIHSTSQPFRSVASKLQTTRTSARPSSQCDNLRIQVSKKMAAAAPAGGTKYDVPHVVLQRMPFQAPASPVAQCDIIRQQESLQRILQHKIKEEELLKQQQEEWMRQNDRSIALDREEQPEDWRRYDDSSEIRALGNREQRRENDEGNEKDKEVRSSDESVLSTASTLITCHRRVTSSIDDCCFLGYEEEETAEDTQTSYTTPALVDTSMELLCCYTMDPDNNSVKALD